MQTRTTFAALAIALGTVMGGAITANAAQHPGFFEGPVSSVLSDRGEPHVIMPRRQRADETHTAEKRVLKPKKDLTPEQREKLRQKYGGGKGGNKGKASGNCNHKYNSGKC